MSEQDKDLPLPFPPDAQQMVFLEIAADRGCLIASPGTDRFEALQILVDGGYLLPHYCESALGVYQFILTKQGVGSIENQNLQELSG